MRRIAPLATMAAAVMAIAACQEATAPRANVADKQHGDSLPDTAGGGSDSGSHGSGAAKIEGTISKMILHVDTVGGVAHYDSTLTPLAQVHVLIIRFSGPPSDSGSDSTGVDTIPVDTVPVDTIPSDSVPVDSGTVRHDTTQVDTMLWSHPMVRAGTRPPVFGSQTDVGQPANLCGRNGTIVKNVTTNEHGAYTAGGLDAGGYAVLVQPAADNSYNAAYTCVITLAPHQTAHVSLATAGRF